MLSRIGSVAFRRAFTATPMKPITRTFGAAAHAHNNHAHDAHGHHDAHHDGHHDDHHGDHGHDHHGPHVPEGYDKLGKFCLITAYLWVFYMLKENKGQLFGYHQPWLEAHEHEHYHYVKGEVGSLPRFVEEHGHDHDEHEEHDDDEHEH